MRLLLDENLSERLVDLLRPEFDDCVHVRSIGLGGASDADVWHAARDAGRVLLTKDEDFIRLSMALGAPPKVIRLDVGNASNADVAARLKECTAIIESFAIDAGLAFLVLARRPR